MIKLNLLLICILMTTVAEAQDTEQGDLIYLNVDVVAPENMIAYEKWDQEFMEATKGMEIPEFWTFPIRGSVHICIFNW